MSGGACATRGGGVGARPFRPMHRFTRADVRIYARWRAFPQKRKFSERRSNRNSWRTPKLFSPEKSGELGLSICFAYLPVQCWAPQWVPSGSSLCGSPNKYGMSENSRTHVGHIWRKPRSLGPNTCRTQVEHMSGTSSESPRTYVVHDTNQFGDAHIFLASLNRAHRQATQTELTIRDRLHLRTKPKLFRMSAVQKRPVVCPCVYYPPNT